MKNKPFILLCCLISLSLFHACEDKDDQQSNKNNDKVVAFVNYDKIYLSQLRDETKQFSAKYGISFSGNKERYQKTAKFILDELILKKIYFQEAERLKITTDAGELENYLRHVGGDYSRDDFSRMFELRNKDLSKWKEQVRENKLFEKLIAKEVKDKIIVKESEIKAYYKAYSKDYMLPDRVQALQIVVNNELEAEAIYNKLQEGAAFFDLAKTKSMSPEGDQGGDLGFFSSGQMPKEFVDAIFNLKVGEFSKVVQTPYGYHIFKVIKKKRAKIMSLKDAKGKIREKLKKEKEKKQFMNWINHLRGKSVIVIKEDVLSGI
jgi:parvulin-like peptidyl-prolyl isomerase